MGKVSQIYTIQRRVYHQNMILHQEIYQYKSSTSTNEKDQNMTIVIDAKNHFITFSEYC